MTDEIREGLYEDKYGRWQKDRRVTPDRRRSAPGKSLKQHERRSMFRRKADREVFETDHREMINDALEDFASEHGGHL